jgi:hypothetical protein
MNDTSNDKVIVRPVKDADDNLTGEWYYRHEAGNNDSVNTSETYTEKSTAVEAAHREADPIGAEVIVEGETESDG